MRKTGANRLTEKEREIRTQWSGRPAEQRTNKHIEDFADDMSRQGLALSPNATLNIHAIRGLFGIWGEEVCQRPSSAPSANT